MKDINEKARKLGLPESSTPEELQSNFRYSKFLQFGERVLMAGYRYNGLNEKGYYGAIYAFKNSRHTCEDEVRLMAVSDEFFHDDGHAIEWAITA